MKVTAEMVESLAALYLSPGYDTPRPTPDFHRQCWGLYASGEKMCAVAAPRGHAKSTALTHDYGLAEVLFREEEYVIIVSASEEMAIEHLGDISRELHNNDDLRADFKIRDFVVDQKTDIIVECTDGYQFRILARGAEQKIRGRKWHGKRPGLILCDDLEDDEQVENKDRREKFQHWFNRACLQSLRDGGKIRVHGTILHDGSLLNGIMKNGSWSTLRYKAHRSYDEFDDILWPEMFSAEKLKGIRQNFINNFDSAGYSQEYLNDPRDNDDAYLRKEWLVAMAEDDYASFKRFGCGVDLAISKPDRSNRSSFTIGGKDISNILHVVDQRTGRWDSLEIVDEFFAVKDAWAPEFFIIEKGQIWSAIEPLLYKEMQERDKWLNIIARPATKDKAARGKPFQARAKGRGMRWDKRASWWPGYEDEVLKFTGNAEAVLDDQFDSTAWLVIGMEYLKVEDEDKMSESEMEEERQSLFLRRSGSGGRSLVTGY